MTCTFTHATPKPARLANALNNPPDKARVGYNFFFQAEDGIRDPEMSRGLGDVYKRQPLVSDIEPIDEED